MAIGASRMIHHSTFCTTASAERTKAEERVGGLADLEGGDADGDRDDEDLQHVERQPDASRRSPALPRGPRTLAGTRPVRKSSHEPVLDGRGGGLRGDAACGRRAAGPARARCRWTTAISAVMANQASVFQASRAAPVTSRRLAIEATIARKTSGGTTARSRVTKMPPTVLRVSVSQLGSTSPVAASTPSAPMERATRPRTTPRTRPIRTWTPNEGSQRRARGSEDVLVEVLRRCSRRWALQDGGGGGSCQGSEDSPTAARRPEPPEVDDEATRQQVALGSRSVHHVSPQPTVVPVIPPQGRDRCDGCHRSPAWCVVGTCRATASTPATSRSPPTSCSPTCNGPSRPGSRSRCARTTSPRGAAAKDTRRSRGRGSERPWPRPSLTFGCRQRPRPALPPGGRRAGHRHPGLDVPGPLLGGAGER